MEIPVVAYYSGGPKEIVEEDKTGYLVRAYDSKKMANKTLYLLAHEDVRLRFGKEARKRVANCFSIEKHVAAMEKLFETEFK